jgi:hypothetical protein
MGGNLLRDLSPDYACALDRLHFQQMNYKPYHYLQTMYWLSPYARSCKHVTNRIISKKPKIC